MGNSSCKQCTFLKGQQNQLRKIGDKNQQKFNQISNKINTKKAQPGKFVQNTNDANIQIKKNDKKDKQQIQRPYSLQSKQISTLDIALGESDQNFLPLESKFSNTYEVKDVIKPLNVHQRIEQKDIIIKQWRPIPVPFQVIKLLMKKDIVDNISKYQSNFLESLQDAKNQSYQTWKMQKLGYYTNKFSNGSCIIVTDNLVYKGLTKLGQFIPQQNGILFTAQGVYDGHFKNGKAHGRGLYINLKQNLKITGLWQDGHIVKGKIQSDFYKYEGLIKNNKPNGQGQLTLKTKNQSQCKFIGNFQQGKFHGKGEYQCFQYIYNGNFENGKKHGQGKLRFMNIKSYKDWRKQHELSGMWKQDKLIQYKK